jgi:hypothetical protein
MGCRLRYLKILIYIFRQLYEPQVWDVKPGQTPGRATNHAVQFFPYGEHDFDDNPQQDPKGFRKMVLEWKDVFATCGGQKVCLMDLNPIRKVCSQL